MNRLFNFLYHFSTTGLVRGLVSMAIGWAIGANIIVGLRQSQNLPPSSEASLFLGALFGFIFFLFGTGVLTDWTKWAMGKKTPLVHGAPEHRPSWWRYLSVDYNHKVIGIQ
jgi:cytochrome c oxidase subunit 1